MTTLNFFTVLALVSFSGLCFSGFSDCFGGCWKSARKVSKILHREVYSSEDKKILASLDEFPLGLTPDEYLNIKDFVKNVLLILKGVGSNPAQRSYPVGKKVNSITYPILEDDQRAMRFIILELMGEFALDEKKNKHAFSVNKDKEEVKRSVAALLYALPSPRGGGFRENDLRSGLIRAIDPEFYKKREEEKQLEYRNRCRWVDTGVVAIQRGKWIKLL